MSVHRAVVTLSVVFGEEDNEFDRFIDLKEEIIKTGSDPYYKDLVPKLSWSITYNAESTLMGEGEIDGL